MSFLFYCYTIALQFNSILGGEVMSNYSDEMEQEVQQKVDKVKQYGTRAVNRALSPAKKAVRKGLKTGAKAAAKFAGKALLKLGALLIKGIVAIVSFILSLGAPVLLFIGGILLLIGFCYYVEYELRPVNQNMQSETHSEMNKQEQTAGRPQGSVASISDYNLVVNAFYMGYSMDSYYKVYEGNIYTPGKPVMIQPTLTREDGAGTVTADENFELKDATNLESQFLLSYELLWQLDEYLHDKGFKYPESFLKPLYTEQITASELAERQEANKEEDKEENQNKEDDKEKATRETSEDTDKDEIIFVVKDLTDEDGNLIVKSKVYDEDGNRIEDEETEGVWDYGLAPIIHYETYLKDARYEFDVIGKSYKYKYKLPEGAVLTETFEGVEAGELTADDTKTYAKPHEYFDSASASIVPMISQVTTFVGTFKPTIDYSWQRKSQSFETVTEEVGKKTEIREMSFEKMVPRTDSQGRALKAAIVNGRQVAEVSAGCFTLSQSKEFKYILTQTCGTQKPLVSSNLPITFVDLLDKRTVKENVEVELTEVITYGQYLAEIEPRYQGKPELIDFKGGSYLRDYLAHYETHVPETVLNDLDLSNRVAKDPEKLKEIIEEYNQMQSGGSIAIGDVPTVGSADQANVDRAARYLDLFKKYAEIYGVDPYLLLAKAAQESSGDHESHLTGGAAVGLMQIERPGNTEGHGVSQVTAYNHKTKSDEVVNVCKGNSNSPAPCLNVYDVENNIKVGAMQLAQRYTVFDGHHMLSLQSYNFGEGGMRTTVRICGLDLEDVKKDQYNLDWMDCRIKLYNDPGLVNRPDLETYGDPNYIENVLKFYHNPETNNHLIYTDRNGNVHKFDVSKIDVENGGFIFSTTPSKGGLLSSLGNFLKNRFNKIVESLSSFFEDIPTHYELPTENTRHYESKLAPIDLQIMETMIFAMKQQVNLDAIGKVTDEMWKDRYADVFVNHQTNTGNNLAGDGDPYFEGGARTPLPYNIDPVFVYRYEATIEGLQNPGVGVTVAPGTSIHAIYDGTVLKVGDSSEYKGYSIHIQHANGMVSIYNRLDPSSVKLQEGDVVKKGDIIGAVAGSSDPQQQYFHFELHQNGSPVNPTYLFQSANGGDYFIPASEGSFIIPLVKGRVTCEFGNVCYYDHRGIDLADYQSYTTPIVAAASGTVVETGFDGDGYGNYVKIDHLIDGNKYRTVYAHMVAPPIVKKGDIVEQGQMLGRQGSTGNSSGPHLHFEIRTGGLSYSDVVNPRLYIDFPSSWDFTQ